MGFKGTTTSGKGGNLWAGQGVLLFSSTLEDQHTHSYPWWTCHGPGTPSIWGLHSNRAEPLLWIMDLSQLLPGALTPPHDAVPQPLNLIPSLQNQYRMSPLHTSKFCCQLEIEPYSVDTAVSIWVFTLRIVPRIQTFSPQWCWSLNNQLILQFLSVHQHTDF